MLTFLPARECPTAVDSPTQLDSTLLTQLNLVDRVIQPHSGPNRKNRSPVDVDGITGCITAKVSALCRIAWQHRFPQLSYCCM